MVFLEPLAPIHAAGLQPLLEDPAIAATTPFIHPYPPDGAKEYIRESMALREAGTKYVFAVCESPGQAIGMALLKDVDPHGQAELGYWIGRPHWGQGHATAAAAEILSFGFGTLGLQTIAAVTLEANPASIKVLAKLGFVEVARSTWSLPKWTEPKPCITLQLSAEAWRQAARPRSGSRGGTGRPPWRRPARGGAP